MTPDIGAFVLVGGLIGLALLICCGLTWLLNRAGIE